MINNHEQEVASKLNLAKHYVKGSKELNAKQLATSADLRAYRGAKTVQRNSIMTPDSLNTTGSTGSYGEEVQPSVEYLLVNFWR